MNLCRVLSLAFLSASTTVLAQNAIVAGTACPVHFEARHSPDTALLRARTPDTERPRESVTQRLQLTIANNQSRDITGIELTAHGHAARPTLQITQSGAHSTEITKRLSLPVSVLSDTSRTVEIVLPGFTGVGALDLLTVSYKDGTAWHASASSSCTIVPDGLLYIGAQ